MIAYDTSMLHAINAGQQGGPRMPVHVCQQLWHDAVSLTLEAFFCDKMYCFVRHTSGMIVQKQQAKHSLLQLRAHNIRCQDVTLHSDSAFTFSSDGCICAGFSQ